MHDIFELAKTIGHFTQWNVFNNLDINRVLYMANVISLGKSDGKTPLVKQRFYATDLGPIFPGLYKFQSCFGARTVHNIHYRYGIVTDPDAVSLLKSVIYEARSFVPGQWVAVTHNEKGGWAKNYQPGLEIPISNQDMQAEYSSVYTKQ
jgi:uncharacterized phage-associated protein